MKKSDMKAVAMYFATRDKENLAGIELPATVKQIVEDFDAIPVKGVNVESVKATLSDASEIVADGVKGGMRWVKSKIKI